jgi:hypothetical protein
MRGHNFQGHGWIAAVAILLLVVAHAVLFGVAARLHYSVLLVAGVVGIVLVKYGWWKLRR